MPQPTRLFLVALLALWTGVAGCGRSGAPSLQTATSPRTTPEDTGGVGDDGAGLSPDVAPDSTARGDDAAVRADVEPCEAGELSCEIVEAACAEACDDADALDGGCAGNPDPTGVSDCEPRCEALASTGDERGIDAISECLRTNPLCFETLEDCAISVLYPSPQPYTFIMRGRDFGASAGARVRARVSVDGAWIALGSGTVRGDGTWRIDGVLETLARDTHPARYYVDRDGDASCSVPEDLVGSGFFNRLSGLQEPRFTLRVEPDERGIESVCPVFRGG